MEIIGAVLLTLAVGLVVVVFVSQPFLRRQPPGPDDAAGQPGSDDHRRSSLLAERDRIVNALQELDFDYTLGKIPEDEYPFQRGALFKRGAEVLRSLDEIQAASQPAAGTIDESIEARIEAAVQARRADAARASGALQPASPAGSANGGGNTRDELEELIASRKRERKESAAGFCPHCGKPVQKSDKFCARCGAVL